MLPEIGKTLVILGLGTAILGRLLWVSDGSLKNLPIDRFNFNYYLSYGQCSHQLRG